MPGAPLIPTDVLGNPDKSVLFTGSGMEQFKPYFTGAATPPSPRITTVQKCVRAVDIDSVGDFSHCTFFEMLGNFSFGDYFKAEVIPWTWEFLTKVVGLDPERLCVTVYEEDEEAFNIWHNVVGLPVDRIHRQGEDKNFWPASVISQGPDGPCGPCSEIFYRVAPLEEMTTDASLTPAQRYKIDDDAARWVEIWNNVFTQFNRSEQPDGTPLLTPLPRRNNDTGAGLDRIAYVSQGKSSVFETDLFGPTLQRIEELTNRTYTGTMSPTDFAFRVVAEHTRSMVFCIADGILPSNEGRGYVLRYIMRRAIRYGQSVLGFTEPFLHLVAPAIIEQMGDFYTELHEREALILQAIQGEEEQFRRTLDRGMRIFEQTMNDETVLKNKMLSGFAAFDLYSTYGFPFNLTKDLARERGIEVDEKGFLAEMEAQRKQSQKGSNIDKDVFSSKDRSGLSLTTLQDTEFLGYHTLTAECEVIAILFEDNLVNKLETSAASPIECTVVLNRTPCYAESGGQVGDQADLISHETPLAAKIVNTRKREGIYLHTVELSSGRLELGQKLNVEVDAGRRTSIMRNHTATHLMQAALRKVLGEHVHQKGSLVAPDRLRFDFTHGQPVSYSQLREVEVLVCAEIYRDLPVSVHVDIAIEQAKQRGAMALFGEKYGDKVRMVEVPDFSLELCGGTHVQSTAQIGIFRIVSESGSSSGVRRIEAVTGQYANSYLADRENTLAQIISALKSGSGDPVAATEKLVNRNRELEKQIKQLQTSGNAVTLPEPVDVQGVPLITAQVAGLDAEALGLLAESTVKRLGSGAVVLGAEVDGKAVFAAKISPDLVARGVNAGTLMRDISRSIGGGGGGKPDFATAGARDTAKIQEALNLTAELLNSGLSRN